VNVPDSSAIQDQECELRFAECINENETNASSKEYLLYILGIFKVLISCKQYQQAVAELNKMIEQFAATYQMDSNHLIELGKEFVSDADCMKALETTFGLYKEALKHPQKQFIADNRVVTFKL